MDIAKTLHRIRNLYYLAYGKDVTFTFYPAGNMDKSLIEFHEGNPFWTEEEAGFQIIVYDSQRNELARSSPCHPIEMCVQQLLDAATSAVKQVSERIDRVNKLL